MDIILNGIDKKLRLLDEQLEILKATEIKGFGYYNSISANLTAQNELYKEKTALLQKSIRHSKINQ